MLKTIKTDIPVAHHVTEERDILFLNALWECIENHVSKPGFGVAELASCMHMSRVQLNRKLQVLTGHSPAALIIRHRMQTAVRLLQDGKYTIKEIAWKCGFTNQANFCRCFIKEQQCSPMQFRKQQTDHTRSLQEYNWKLPLSEEHITHLLHLAQQKSWLSKVLRYIIDNIDDTTLTVEQIAATTYMTPVSLNRKVKQIFAINSLRLVKDIKLQYASELMISRKSSVSEVAYMTGFYDPAHLTRNFKTAFGCTPSAYRLNTPGLPIHLLKEKLVNQNDK
jgi:AraC-like DNA-binding protein